eukprot:323739_1
MERKELFEAQSRSWTPLEDEFLAENELIEIIPNFSCPKREFIQGTFGPFQPNRIILVPIWLATTLKKSKKCSIKLPNWMEENELKNILKEEKTNDSFYNGLPFYYREISKLIFDIDTGNNYKNIRVLIQDIEDVRESKCRRGLKQLESSTYIVHLNNISSNQLNRNIRINVCNLLNYFYDITKVGPNKNSDDQSQTQNTNTQATNNSNNSYITHSNNYSQSSNNNYNNYDQENEFNSANNNNNGQPMRKLRKLR